MLAYPFDRQAQKALAQTKRHFSEGSGYMIQQATRPQTIGHCLADSPVGLLAWIYEKLVNWSDGYPWSDDEGKLRISYIHRDILITTYFSTGVGIDILVLACRTDGLSADVLRDDWW